ncbi:MAG: TetR/AcrR family transcriptional regulator [Bacteroidia bacterium]|nr:TetR/AcrR family transcriptional regulator [Bacteroidia bacterium]
MEDNSSQKPSLRRKRGRPVASVGADTDRILDVALQHFARHGYVRVSLQKISDEIGIATSLLNYHYGSKEGLWRKAVKKAYDQLTLHADQSNVLFKDLDPVAYGKAMTRWFIHYSANHPALYQIMLYEMATRTDRGKWLLENVSIPLSKRLEFSLDQQVKKGASKPIPHANWISIILGACTNFFMMKDQMRIEYDIDVFDKQQIDQHADLVIDILYSGIIAKSEE